MSATLTPRPALAALLGVSDHTMRRRLNEIAHATQTKETPSVG